MRSGGINGCLGEFDRGGTEQRRRAKIVATLGPASNNEQAFRQLVRAGLDVARLNFSHGTHAEKPELIQMVREVARQEESPSAFWGPAGP